MERVDLLENFGLYERRDETENIIYSKSQNYVKKPVKINYFKLKDLRL